jgi:hypothetical protein
MNTATLTLDTVAASRVVTLVERLELGEPAALSPWVDAPRPPGDDPRRTAEQMNALPGVIDQVRGWGRRPGFAGAVVLSSRDHNRITVYSQFESGTEFVGRQAPQVIDTVLTHGVAARILDRRLYDLVWRDGNDPVTVISASETPSVHFGLFTVLNGQADALQDKIEASASASLATPGLRTVNFHRSHDGERMINLGTWTTFEAHHVLLRQRGFLDNAKYWRGLAAFQPDYFDVVEVVAGQATERGQKPGSAA